jgi:hypothetical protein
MFRENIVSIVRVKDYGEQTCFLLLAYSRWKQSLAQKRQFKFASLHGVTSQTTVPLQVYIVCVLDIGVSNSKYALGNQLIREGNLFIR